MVLNKSGKKGLLPPGGCLRKPMQIAPWDLSRLCHLVVAIAAGDKVVIIKAEVKVLLQRFNVMHLKRLVIEARYSECSVASLVAYPAHVVIPPDDIVSLLLPGIRSAE